jgi:protein-tyrosine phosphatase
MDLYWIDGCAKGRIAVAKGPRGGDRLEGDLRDGRASGVDVLVSMLPRSDAEALGLVDEGRIAEAIGMRFLSVPVPDFAVPESVDAIVPELSAAHEAMTAGRAVAVHCRMGMGRSPLFAACVLVLGGGEPEDVWRRIQQARGVRVPDTAQQRAWLSNVVAWRDRR